MRHDQLVRLRDAMASSSMLAEAPMMVKMRHEAGCPAQFVPFCATDPGRELEPCVCTPRIFTKPHQLPGFYEFAGGRWVARTVDEVLAAGLPIAEYIVRMERAIERGTMSEDFNVTLYHAPSCSEANDVGSCTCDVVILAESKVGGNFFILRDGSVEQVGSTFQEIQAGVDRHAAAWGKPS